jgi:hypothetical protein
VAADITGTAGDEKSGHIIPVTKDTLGRM